MYIILFKEDGERYTSLVEGVHFETEKEKIEEIDRCRKEALASGYKGELKIVEATEEEQELYSTNEYVLDQSTGKPVLRPPYVPTIRELAETKWREIKTARDTAEQSGCPYMGKVIDSDQTSVQRISIAVQAAQAAIASEEDFFIEWTMQDNSVVRMNAEQVIGMSAALALYSNKLHEQARGIRAQIDKIVRAFEKGGDEAEARGKIEKLEWCN